MMMEVVMFGVQMFRRRETEQREDVAWLQQERLEMQHSISLLELDNQALRDEIQQLRGETARAEPLSPGGNADVGL